MVRNRIFFVVDDVLGILFILVGEMVVIVVWILVIFGGKFVLVGLNFI